MAAGEIHTARSAPHRRRAAQAAEEGGGGWKLEEDGVGDGESIGHGHRFLGAGAEVHQVGVARPPAPMFDLGGRAAAGRHPGRTGGAEGVGGDVDVVAKFGGDGVVNVDELVG